MEVIEGILGLAAGIVGKYRSVHALREQCSDAADLAKSVEEVVRSIQKSKCMGLGIARPLLCFEGGLKDIYDVLDSAEINFGSSATYCNFFFWFSDFFSDFF